MFGAIYRWFFAPSKSADEERRPLPDGVRFKVAIVGAGIGGCTAAYFLRELGGDNVELHVYSDGLVGGRAATAELDGHFYETGGSVIHTSNKYLVDLAKKFGLNTQTSASQPTTPVGIFDGTKFALRTGTWSICNLFKLLWRYGFSMLWVNRSVASTLKDFVGIYKLQSESQSYATMADMLKAMGGEEMFLTTQVSARDFCKQKGWSQRMVDELISGALRVNYGQGQEMDAFTMLVALAGMEDTSLWSVVGGNKLIPLNALRASGADIHTSRVTKITRKANGSRPLYVLDSKDLASGTVTTDEFDVCILAFPLNTPSPFSYDVPFVQFEGFPLPIYTPPTCQPYHNTVATFIKGEINPQFFGCNDVEHDFPLLTLTTDYSGPSSFNSVAVQIPCDIPDSDTKQYLKPLCQDPVRIWKVFTSNRPLSDDQKDQMFKNCDPSVNLSVSWLAYPEYRPPQELPPFVLDDAMFYVNAVEMAASAMEMSVIGAKNVALLTMEYLTTKVAA